jgi:hypothetical protein
MSALLRTRTLLFVLLSSTLLLSGPARADNRVRILFDDTENTYRPRTSSPDQPTDGCRPAVDDSDDNGCVTEAAGTDDDTSDEGAP